MDIPSGEDIHQARNSRGLTQRDLADRAGVSQPLIARIESGDLDPTVDTLYRIVSVLNNTPTDVDQEEVKLSMPSVLREARDRTGYTQGELADAADVSQPLISRIENQEVNPRVSTLRSLFKHLDTDPKTSEDSSLTESTGVELLATMQQEFSSIQTASTATQSDEPTTDAPESSEQCPACETDLRTYPNPNYCPDCGDKL